jgi:hypothetical protein
MIRSESSTLAAGEFLTKKRYIWHAGAMRLLRERACAQYARRVTPHVVDGVHIEFPETQISLGIQVIVRSRRIEGEALFELLYRQETRQCALDLGITALKALHSASVGSAPLSLFGRAYQPIRELKAAVSEVLGSSLLAPEQRRELRRLVLDYNRDHGEKKVLVHGDLQPSHLIVDPSGRSLGFIDLEAMRIGKAATNFAQLWIGYHIADPLLGRSLYERYAGHHPDPLDARFDTDVRAEMALRCHRHVLEGRRLANRTLEEKAHTLLIRVLSGISFEEVCLGG